MTTVPGSTGRSAMTTEWFAVRFAERIAARFAVGVAKALAWLALLGCPALAQEAPLAVPPVAAEAAHQVAAPDGLRARLLPDQPSAVRALAPAIFTDLSPVTASEPALRLPEDQRDDG